ncbi:MAG: hypothetical protein JWM44_4570 [Bacilli bacterium]|nr:hypothetical protein [Bacilli bacterium]
MQSFIQIAIPFVLISFLIYRRVKRSIGFQRFSPKRMQFRIILFGILGLVMLALGFLHPILFLADGIGITCGAVLAFYAIRHSVFEWRDTILYSRTHVVIESTVIILFLGRVLYRILFVFNGVKNTAAASDPNQMQQYTKDPFTVAIFLVIVAYYMAYYTFVIRKGKSLIVEKQ